MYTDRIHFVLEATRDPMASAPGVVTRLLHEVSGGRSEAYDELLPLVYADLRRRARRYLGRERCDHTLSPTALVHEAYLKLVDQHSVDWRGRGHFFAIASRVMRRILVDHARRHRRAKRGGGSVAVAVEDQPDTTGVDAVDLVALDSALTRLGELDARQGQVVELRYFGGLSVEETADVLAVSTATVKREWAMARAWLFDALTGTQPTARGS